MRTKAAEWYECTATVQKMQDDGTQKPVAEKYVVDALSFTEAETRITEELNFFYSGFVITKITKASYHEIFFSEKDSADRFYKCKLAFITLGEKTGKEKRSNVFYLMHAHTFSEALEQMKGVMDGTMVDYEVVSITETKIMDVFEHCAIAATNGEGK